MSAERREVARRVMKAMRHEVARHPLAQAGPDGAQKLVICLADDTVAYAERKVREAGGIATVVVPRGGGLVPLVWESVDDDHALIDVNSPIHPDSTLGLLVEYLGAGDIREIAFRVSADGGETMVTGRDQITVPA